MILKKLKFFLFGYLYKTQRSCCMQWVVCAFLSSFFLVFSVENAFSEKSNSENFLKFELQVAMIFKILDFIQWPDFPFYNSNKIFRIGVFGNSPILEAIQLLEEETIKGLQVEVQLVENIRDAKKFHLLYVCPPKTDSLQSILNAIGDTKTLTISKVDGFAEKGGMINFYETKGKMRFEINLDKVKKSGLKISSRLLSLSKIVDSERK